jgi:hypothetical protein
MKKNKVKKLEGEELLTHLGHEAFNRCVTPFKARLTEEPTGEAHCGFRYADLVLIGVLAWKREGEKVNVNLQVKSISPQTGELEGILNHDFQEAI